MKLTREYADGMDPKPEREKITGHSLYQPPTENTGEMGEMKYFAMLRYEDSTVMEVDIDSGIYHLVYTKNNDFDLLRAGGLFQDTYRVFVARSVHPDDRAEMLNFQHGRDFLASGSTKRSHKCRVFNHDLGDYTWYQVSSLRINMADPRQHRIILVWRELAQTPKSQGRQTSQDSHALENTMVGFYQCLNDQYFTILQANRGFTALLEYSREEIAQKFNNRFLELLQPDEGQQVMAKFLKEISRKNTAELEFRLTTKSGRVIWALEKCQLFTGEDGFEYLNCVLIDITKTKAAQEKLRLTMERHQIILNQTNDIIFEWDINQDRIHYSANWLKKFGYQPITENVSQKIPQVSHLMPQDIPGFLNLMQDVIAGLAYGETEVRVADADGHYLWCRIRATTQFNAEGKPLKAIGVILDIDSEKRLAQDLIEKAKKDHLTNLYNKNAAFRRIKEFMKQEQKTTNSAMMLIDLDNFKAINDNFGHMFGDAVLIEVAGLLKKLFHLEDIIARVGGDEFLIYIHNLPQEEILAEKAKSLINAIQNILAQELQSCHLSCSIGAAYYHKDAENFHDLYQCCDRALHSAKVQGKNKCALYDKDTMSKIFDLGSQELMRPNTRIESDEAYDFETIALIQEIARDLYQNDDTDAVINSILQLIGRRYNVSRAYIFEDSADGSYCSNTFEWCSEGIEPQINQLQNVKHEDLGDYYSNFDVNGVFYCVNTETLPPQQYQIIADQGIHSMLQCIIYNNGEPAGFIGFDDCLNKRMWDQNQIKPLTLLAELLSTFLLKKRVQDKLAQGTKDLHTLLNNQNSWIYVIDPDTFKLRYLNAKTREIAPHAEEGMCCHSVFFQRATPCRLCPAQNIRAAVNTTMEVYNPVLQVWSMADASLIRWGGEEACLLSCHDITPYKQGQTSPAQGNK